MRESGAGCGGNKIIQNETAIRRRLSFRLQLRATALRRVIAGLWDCLCLLQLSTTLDLGDSRLTQFICMPFCACVCLRVKKITWTWSYERERNTSALYLLCYACYMYTFLLVCVEASICEWLVFYVYVSVFVYMHMQLTYMHKSVYLWIWANVVI